MRSQLWEWRENVVNKMRFFSGWVPVPLNNRSEGDSIPAVIAEGVGLSAK